MPALHSILASTIPLLRDVPDVRRSGSAVLLLVGLLLLVLR